MSCDRYLDLISARLDGPLSQQDEAELTAHLNTCPHCRAIADDLANIHSTLTDCTVTPPAELAEGVMKSIRGQRTARRRTFRQLGALAACLVLCVGLFALTRTKDTPMDTPDVARHVEPFALSEDLTFTNVQRIRLNDAEAASLPTAALLDSADSLPAVAQRYDADFFLTHRLLAVVVQEPSSSIAHTVTALTEDCVTVLRDVPQAGDSDMAQWLILAEVDGAGPEIPLVLELQTN